MQPNGYRDELADIRADVAALKKDMWVGNGKPGVTARLLKLEDCVDKIERTLDRLELRQEVTNEALAKLAKYVWIGVGILLAGDAALKVFFH